MTVWPARDVAGFWQGAGGPASRDVEWVAIAMGESSLDDHALSSAGAIGLWQIMPFHAADFGITVDSLYDPRTNALVTVSLSGHGTNCAAWDSCYANIYASGRYAFLAFPEVGSADYNNLATAASEIGKNVPTLTTISPSDVPGRSVDKAIERINFALHREIPAISAQLIRERQALGKLFTKGWRP